MLVLFTAGSVARAALAHAAPRRSPFRARAVDGQFQDSGRLLHQGVDADDRAFVAGSASAGLACRSGRSTPRRSPWPRSSHGHCSAAHPRPTAGSPTGKTALDIPAKITGLSRVPQIDRPPLAADGILPAPVGVHPRRPGRHVRRDLGPGPLPRLLQTRRTGLDLDLDRPSSEHAGTIAVDCGSRKPGAQPPDIARVLCNPGQREQRQTGIIPACEVTVRFCRISQRQPASSNRDTKSGSDPCAR